MQSYIYGLSYHITTNIMSLFYSVIAICVKGFIFLIRRLTSILYSHGNIISTYIKYLYTYIKIPPKDMSEEGCSRRPLVFYLRI